MTPVQSALKGINYSKNIGKDEFERLEINLILKDLTFWYPEKDSYREV